MSSPSDIPLDASGKVFVNAQVFASPGKADEVQQHLSAIRKLAVSQDEPGCREYRTVRSFVKDGSVKFAVFEEYESVKAVQAHFDGAPYKAFAAAAGKGLLAAPPQIEFFYEFE